MTTIKTKQDIYFETCDLINDLKQDVREHEFDIENIKEKIDAINKDLEALEESAEFYKPNDVQAAYEYYESKRMKKRHKERQEQLEAAREATLPQNQVSE